MSVLVTEETVAILEDAVPQIRVSGETVQVLESVTSQNIRICELTIAVLVTRGGSGGLRLWGFGS